VEGGAEEPQGPHGKGIKAGDYESPKQAGAGSYLSVGRGQDRCHVNHIDQIEPFSGDHSTCND
jgi:hypothetical protein